MLNRGLEEASVFNQETHKQVVRFHIENASTRGLKRIYVEDLIAGEKPKRPVGRERRKLVLVADNLDYAYAIGCVNKMIRIYLASDPRLSYGGVCDNLSNVRGVEIA